jgi:hypothetical protein
MAKPFYHRWNAGHIRTPIPCRTRHDEYYATCYCHCGACYRHCVYGQTQRWWATSTPTTIATHPSEHQSTDHGDKASSVNTRRCRGVGMVATRNDIPSTVSVWLGTKAARVSTLIRRSRPAIMQGMESLTVIVRRHASSHVLYQDRNTMTCAHVLSASP